VNKETSEQPVASHAEPARSIHIAPRQSGSLAELQDEIERLADQFAATSEVLRIISASPGELEPVFQPMLENAVRICRAKFGTLFRFDGELFRFAAEVGTPPEFARFQQKRGSFPPLPGTILEAVMRTKAVAHIEDDAARTARAHRPAWRARVPCWACRCSMTTD
jgi:hypothetical protein